MAVARVDMSQPGLQPGVPHTVWFTEDRDEAGMYPPSGVAMREQYA